MQRSEILTLDIKVLGAQINTNAHLKVTTSPDIFTNTELTTNKNKAQSRTKAYHGS